MPPELQAATNETSTPNNTQRIPRSTINRNQTVGSAETQTTHTTQDTDTVSEHKRRSSLAITAGGMVSEMSVEVKHDHVHPTNNIHFIHINVLRVN